MQRHNKTLVYKQIASGECKFFIFMLHLYIIIPMSTYSIQNFIYVIKKESWTIFLRCQSWVTTLRTMLLFLLLICVRVKYSAPGATTNTRAPGLRGNQARIPFDKKILCLNGIGYNGLGREVETFTQIALLQCCTMHTLGLGHPDPLSPPGTTNKNNTTVIQLVPHCYHCLVVIG